MKMQSSNLLPALQKLPVGQSGQHRSFREIITGLANMDRDMKAAEFAADVSIGMWAVFPSVNVDDGLRETMTRAHEMVFKTEVRTLTEHWQDVMGLPKETLDRVFMSLFKGKVAELETNRLLGSDGWTDMTLAPPSDNQFWDNIGINPDGKVAVIQVKTGESYSNSHVQAWMAEDHPNLYEKVYTDVQKWTADPKIMEQHPELATIAERLADGPDSFVSDRYFAFGSELYGKAVPSGIDETGRIVADIGKDYELVGGIKDGLSTLSDNLGLDIPDGIADLVPYAPIIIGGLRLIWGAIKTENEFKTVDRTTKNKIQVVQTLTLMSRAGVPAVFAAGGGAGGLAIGSAVPFLGNLVGGIGGALVGGGVGKYVNTKIEPQMLKLGLNITGLTSDDLFYYKNKSRIDTAAFSFQTTARELAATPV